MPTTLAHKMILRNISGQRMYFGYIGLMGADLADDEDVAVDGNLWDFHARHPMAIAAFKADLEAKRIVIIKSTDTYVYDTTDTRTWVLGANDSLPTVAAPSEGSYIGPAADV